MPTARRRKRRRSRTRRSRKLTSVSEPLTTRVVHGRFGGWEEVVYEVTGLYERVQARLLEIGWGLEDLGERMGGRRRAAVSRVLGRRTMRLSTFRRLSLALGVDREWWARPLEKPAERVKRQDALAWALAEKA